MEKTPQHNDSQNESFAKILNAYVTRIRWIRAWQGAGIGGAIGAFAALLLAGMDYFRWLYTGYPQLAAAMVVCALLGAIINALRPLPKSAVAQSVDRRAGLEDRLVSATEVGTDSSVFEPQLRADAQSSLGTVTPKAVYPVRVNRAHYATVVLALLASGVFLLGNTPMNFLSDAAKAERKEAQAEAAQIERLLKETLEEPKAGHELDAEQRKLAEELRKLQKDLERARIPKEEALRKANEIAQKADELTNKKLDQAELDVKKAESALEKWQKAELEKNGLQNVPTEMSNLTESQRNQEITKAEAAERKAADEVKKAESDLQAIKKQLQKAGLTEAEKKALTDAAKDAQSRADKAKSDQAAAGKRALALKLSKQAQEVLKKMMSDPLWKEAQELARKLKQNAQAAKKNNGQQELTDEQRKEMLKKLEEMLAKLKDDKAMQEYLRNLVESLKKAKEAGNCNCAGVGVSGMMGLGLSSQANGAPSQDTWMGNTGFINKTDKPTASQGQTSTEFSPTQRDDTRGGTETYTEIKAPTAVGNRSSVPYIKVLPGYKQKAESAIRRSQIPKEHEKRVKKYFESLSH